MENIDDEYQHGFEANKEEKSLLVRPKLKIKFSMKNNRETGFSESKEVVDHSGSDGGEGSSKGLGVQMRIFQTEPQNTRMNGNDAVYGEKKLTCRNCKKRFRTPKSLCGHMRCHSDGGFTSSFRLPAGCKRRRTCGGGGGAAVVSVESSVKDDEDELVKGAVYGLMLLATGDEFYRTVPAIKQGEEMRVWEKKEAGSSSANKKPRICGYDDDDDDDKEEKNKLEMVLYKEANSNIGTTSTSSSSAGKKRKRKRIPYASRAHNNKMLIKNAGGQEQVVVVEGDVLDESAKEKSLPCGVRMIGRGGGVHVCKRCSKAFPSGQALGGHMRLHWQAPVQADALALSLSPPAAGAVVEAQAQAGEEQVARKKMFMCLDLNEIPADDDLEEGGY